MIALKQASYKFQIEAGYENICNKLQKMLEFKK